MSSPSQELLNKLFHYREDGELVWVINQSTRAKMGCVAGYIEKSTGYRRIGINYKKHPSHILVWILHNGYAPENEIDHIDRDKSNNRIENLRVVSRYCNQRNTGNPKDNTSGVKGVVWYMRDNKWRVQIRILGKLKHLGYHSDFDEAVLHRLAGEQCLGWEGCDSSSPAYQYALKHNLIKRGM